MYLFVDGLQLLGKKIQVIGFISLTQISLSKWKYPNNEFEKWTRQKCELFGKKQDIPDMHLYAKQKWLLLLVRWEKQSLESKTKDLI